MGGIFPIMGGIFPSVMLAAAPLFPNSTPLEDQPWFARRTSTVNTPRRCSCQLSRQLARIRSPSPVWGSMGLSRPLVRSGHDSTCPHGPSARHARTRIEINGITTPAPARAHLTTGSAGAHGFPADAACARTRAWARSAPSRGARHRRVVRIPHAGPALQRGSVVGHAFGGCCGGCA